MLQSIIIYHLYTSCSQVLSEIEDIVDLPFRAQRCAELLGADDAHLVPAFEALVLLAGTAEAAKQAWRRWAGMGTGAGDSRRAVK